MFSFYISLLQDFSTIFVFFWPLHLLVPEFSVVPSPMYFLFFFNDFPFSCPNSIPSLFYSYNDLVTGSGHVMMANMFSSSVTWGKGKWVKSSWNRTFSFAINFLFPSNTVIACAGTVRVGSDTVFSSEVIGWGCRGRLKLRACACTLDSLIRSNTGRGG